MTLNVLEGHSTIGSLFKCDILYLWRILQSFCICRACKFLVPPKISPVRLKLKTSNFVPSLALQSISLWMTNCPSNGHGYRPMTNLKFWGPSYASGTTKATGTGFCTHVGNIKLVVLGWHCPIVGIIGVVWSLEFFHVSGVLLDTSASAELLVFFFILCWYFTSNTSYIGATHLALLLIHNWHQNLG